MRKYFKPLSAVFLFFLASLLTLASLPNNTAEASQKFSVRKETSAYNEKEAIVRIESPEKIEGLSQKYNLSISSLAFSGGSRDFYIARSLDGKSTKKILAELKKEPDVELSQPNYKYKPLARLSNDSLLPNQWALSETSGIYATSSWATERKNQPNLAIAVIDTGTNLKHKDLKKNLTGGSAKGKNFENTKKKPTDTDGHGSFLSGLIAARTNNKRGLAGPSFYNHLKIMALKFDFTTSEAIAAINYARSKNVPVINASWGSYGPGGYDAALKEAIASYPGVFVTASGNNGLDHDSNDPEDRMYPCDFDLPNIICVGASNRNGGLADYSDFGNASVDVVAPGGTDSEELIGLSRKKSNYTRAEGSSLSTALVSAEAGLLISRYPNLSSSQVVEIIKNSADAEPSLSGKVSSGGKVNFQKALQMAANY